MNGASVSVRRKAHSSMSQCLLDRTPSIRSPKSIRNWITGRGNSRSCAEALWIDTDSDSRNVLQGVGSGLLKINLSIDWLGRFRLHCFDPSETQTVIEIAEDKSRASENSNEEVEIENFKRKGGDCVNEDFR